MSIYKQSPLLMQRRNFIATLFSLLALPYFPKVGKRWTQVLWGDIKEGQVFTLNTSLYREDYYYVKHDEYGWNSIHNGVPAKSRCTFDPEKAAWAYHKIKVWTLA